MLPACKFITRQMDTSREDERAIVTEPWIQGDNQDMISLSVIEAAARLGRGEFLPSTYVEALLDKATELEHLNAFVTLDPSAVRAAAAMADVKSRAQNKLGALHGVPFCVKDTIAVEGLPTTAGTPALENYRGLATAPSVSRLQAEGALVFGKTNLHELAFGITSNNAHFGAVHNPHDRSRIAGGSSGGTAAAVAAGITPFGLGADTGGSMRVPASLCGVIGYRPTIGRYDNKGMFILSRTRDTIGTMARSVADIRFLDKQLSCCGSQHHEYKPADLRLSVPRDPYYHDLHPEVALAMERGLAALERAGVTLIETQASRIVELDDLCGFPIAVYETMQEWKSFAAIELGISFSEFVSTIVSPDVRNLFEKELSSEAIQETDYQAAISIHLPTLRDAFTDHFAKHDVAAMIVPTTPLPAIPIGEDDFTELNGQKVPVFPTFTRATRPNSTAGLPGISLPLAKTSDGLPIGLELQALGGTDNRLLAIASTVEAILASPA